MGGMSRKPVAAKVLLALIVAAFVLPITICIVLALALLLAAMGDAVGGLVLRYVAQAGGIVWIAVLVALIFVQAIHTLGRSDECRSVVDWRLWPCKAAPSSEFRIPDSELEGSVELRVPSPQPSRLTPVPSDKILFPRRMLYVEAVLYVTVAATAFGLGYLAGHGGSSAAAKEEAGMQMRVRVEGKVLLVAGSGAKRGDAGAVGHCLARRTSRRSSSADCRSAAREPAAGRAMPQICRAVRVRGAAVRADASALRAICPGRRQLTVS